MKSNNEEHSILGMIDEKTETKPNSLGRKNC